MSHFVDEFAYVGNTVSEGLNGGEEQGETGLYSQAKPCPIQLKIEWHYLETTFARVCETRRISSIFISFS